MLGSEVKPQSKPGFLEELRSNLSIFKGNFLILISSWLMTDFSYELAATYSSLFIIAVGGNPLMVGALGFVSAILGAIVQIPGGVIADKHGKKWFIVITDFIMAAGFVFYALAQSWEWIVVGAVIQSICTSSMPAVLALSMEGVEGDNKGMGFSIINLISSVSTSPAPLIAGLLLSWFGLVQAARIGYMILALSYIVSGMMRMRLEEEKSTTRIRIGEILSSIPRSLGESIRALREIPQSAQRLMMSNFFQLLGYGISLPVLALYLIQDKGISEANYSVMITIQGLSMILFSIPSGWFVDKIGRKWAVITGSILFVISTVMIIYGGYYTILGSTILSSLGWLLASTGEQALLADLIPAEKRGTIYGANGFLDAATTGVAALIGGFVYNGFAHVTVFWLELMMVIPSLVILFTIVEEKMITRKPSLGHESAYRS